MMGLRLRRDSKTQHDEHPSPNPESFCIEFLEQVMMGFPEVLRPDTPVPAILNIGFSSDRQQAE